MFHELLSQISGRIDGALALSLVAHDGMPVESVTSDREIDLEALGADGLLLNLEAVGAVGLVGDTAAPTAPARSITVELALTPLADVPAVHVVDGVVDSPGGGPGEEHRSGGWVFADAGFVPEAFAPTWRDSQDHAAKYVVSSTLL